jgi:hypothetical protein
MALCILVEFYRRFGGKYCVITTVIRSASCSLVGYFVNCSTLKMKAVPSTEMSANFYQTTLRHSPDDSL